MFQHGTGRTTPPPAEPRAGRPRAHPYFFSSSLDGKSWTSLPSTPLADTEMTGLTPMTTYYFRVSVTISRVAGEWSQATSVMLLH